MKGPGSRVGHWNPGEGGGDLGRQGPGVGGQVHVIEVSQGSSPELAEKRRSPPAKQIWVKWEGRSRAVDLGPTDGNGGQEMVGSGD